MPAVNVVAPFRGFSKETVRFFNGLRRTNTRDWFEKNRAVYENHVLASATPTPSSSSTTASTSGSKHAYLKSSIRPG